jgi:acyl-CoA reductase-like NAD-dependent aldehyde dehydrogenase
MPTLKPTLKIHNPATGSVIDEIAADDAASVAARATAARAAQPAWAASRAFVRPWWSSWTTWRRP